MYVGRTQPISYNNYHKLYFM